MFDITKMVLYAAVLSLGLSVKGYAAQNGIENQVIARQLSDILAQEQRPFSGVIMVKRDNQPLLTYYRGEGINEQSQFVIASLSKQITAALILKAVDDGRLSLTNPISHYFKARKQFVSHLPDTVTISHLLSHTSGLINPRQPPLFEPGSQFKYSNYGYTLLGEILTIVDQRPFIEQVNNPNAHSLTGIKAYRGKMSAAQRQLPSLVLGRDETHNAQAHPTSRYDNVDIEITTQLIPAGGMIASAEAYSDFQHKLFSGQLISPQSLMAMTTAHTQRPHRWGDINYGYGTQLNTEQGIAEYSHSGYLPGYMSLALYYPQSKVNVIILENTSWDLSDTQRTFRLHDTLRDSIRTALIAQGSHSTAL